MFLQRLESCQVSLVIHLHMEGDDEDPADRIFDYFYFNTFTYTSGYAGLQL